MLKWNKSEKDEYWYYLYVESKEKKKKWINIIKQKQTHRYVEQVSGYQWGEGKYRMFRSDQIRSVAQLSPTLCDPMNCSMPGLPVHHQLLEFTQTHVHQVSDVIQPSHPLSSPSPPAPNPSQHQSLFQWVNSSHEVEVQTTMD